VLILRLKYKYFLQIYDEIHRLRSFLKFEQISSKFNQ
jgi:hypothetical protein